LACITNYRRPQLMPDRWISSMAISLATPEMSIMRTIMQNKEGATHRHWASSIDLCLVKETPNKLLLIC
ncbi:hypothetical protein L3569_005993, partial [Pseudomonas aeruginosa]